ncbi:MAG: N-acetyltransferase, partial [Pyrobaculum sp.]
MGYISPRARVYAKYISPMAVVYGPSEVGVGSYVDAVTIGYPTRQKLLQSQDPDVVSNGAKIGEGVILRSGVVVYEDVEIGDNCEFGHYVLVREFTKIGRG